MAKLTTAQQADIELYNSLIDLADEAHRLSLKALTESNARYADGIDSEGNECYANFEAQCERQHRYKREASVIWSRLAKAKVVNGSSIIVKV
jgi:hypothetical protein